MNKILRALLVLSLVGGSLTAVTEKTYDKTRPQGVNLAMEYTTWNELLQTKDEDRFGANFQVVPFYQDSDESNELGKYFGVHNKHEFTLGSVAGAIGTYDILSTLIFHDYLNASYDNAATLKYNPSQEVYGVRIDYYQCLGKLLKGLYLKADLPIVHVKNDMGFGVDHVSGTLLTQANIHHYFKGEFSQTAVSGNGQVALTHAKIHGDESTTQVADIDVVLGWKFWDKAKSHLSINLGLTIPTSNESEGHHVFEAQAGNGDHWAFGGGFDFGLNLWTKKDQHIKFEGALNYRYLFEQDEKRTIKLHHLRNYANTADLSDRYSQYYLIAKDLDAQATPAANILTKDLSVTPGSQLDAIVQLAYNNGGFNFEIGYNLFWKDEEEVSRDFHWNDAQYYVVSPTWNTGAANVFDHTTDAYSTVLTHHNLDEESAATPSQLTNKIYGGIGYIFKKWEYPLMLGLAAHYEFADRDEGGIENWGIWGKLGVAF